jgi:hypothetical protein
MSRLSLGEGVPDLKATASLQSVKRLPAKNDGTLSSAVISAGYYAKKMRCRVYVYQGNSFMHLVWRVSDRTTDYLNRINNTGDAVFSVVPELVVFKHDVIR